MQKSGVLANATLHEAVASQAHQDHGHIPKRFGEPADEQPVRDSGMPT